MLLAFCHAPDLPASSFLHLFQKLLCQVICMKDPMPLLLPWTRTKYEHILLKYRNLSSMQCLNSKSYRTVKTLKYESTCSIVFVANVDSLNYWYWTGLHVSISCCLWRNNINILHLLVRQQKFDEETCSFVALQSGGIDRVINFFFLLGYKIKSLYRTRYLLLKLSSCKSLIVCV